MNCKCSEPLEASCPTNFQAELFADGRFDYRCSDNCGCGGDCHANGTASMESASFAVTGGVCRCSLPDDPQGDSPSSPPDPLVGGISVRFSKSAVIFEDEYRDTEDGPLVPRRSTTTRLTISASGGTFGGSFSLALQNLDKLALVGGAGPVSPVASKVLAPYETYYATFECEGVEASGQENDVVVDGTFIEAATWRTENASDVATVVQLELEAVYDAPENHRQDRHVYGVGEKVKFTISPALSDIKLKVMKGDVQDVQTQYYHAGAGPLHSVADDNYWMIDDAGSDKVYNNWSPGRIVWMIPIGWKRILYDGDSFTYADVPDLEQTDNLSSRRLLIGGREDSFSQVIKIDEEGTASVEKFGQKLVRPRWMPLGYVLALMGGD